MATRAEKIERKEFIKELISNGKHTRIEILRIVAERFDIKERQVENYLSEVYKEMETFYTDESEKRFLDDLLWMYAIRNKEFDTDIQLKYQKEINAMLGRNKKQLDVTTAGQPLTLEISINTIDET